MVIFNSYVKLPEGILLETNVIIHITMAAMVIFCGGNGNHLIDMMPVVLATERWQ
jgi:hypothetical protein